jgi:hypothetical protein
MFELTLSTQFVLKQLKFGYKNYPIKCQIIAPWVDKTTKPFIHGNKTLLTIIFIDYAKPTRTFEIGTTTK